MLILILQFFRLEQLLGTSNDLLTEFARTRRGIVEGDENVVVKEDMLLEVRMSKPSKPLRYHYHQLILL